MATAVPMLLNTGARDEKVWKITFDRELPGKNGAVVLKPTTIYYERRDHPGYIPANMKQVTIGGTLVGVCDTVTDSFKVNVFREKDGYSAPLSWYEAVEA